MTESKSLVKKDLSIELMRCVAIWMIVFFHYCAENNLLDSPFYGYKNGGWGSVGTAIFFMISGYCLSLSKDNFDNPTKVLTFYKKRFLSIFPLLWTLFIFGYFFNAVVLNRGYLYGGNPLKIVFSLLGIDGYLIFFGIGNYYVVGEWFTAMILALYLIYPIIFKLFRSKRALTTIVIFAIYFLNIFFNSSWIVSPDATIFTALMLFWMGMIFKEYKETCIKHQGILYALSLISIILVVFIPLPYIGSTLYWKNLLAISLFTVMMLSFPKINLSKIENLVLLEGNLCFCIYLCHHSIIRWQTPILEKFGLTINNHLIRIIIVIIFVQAVAIIFNYIQNKISKMLS